ncbi:PspC domain-containing protein [Caldisalinibacter kiritimatiensis]|uniref:Phage shock protein C, PspC n=1 Tax=Caldisalinibacter kiritimatiensis TaxID=1304284 RepID=R1CME6_9FIRM|nr:PspC domain-containing protein [Caldisalinibacter kiritimatiensis]EOC99875.1 phage shock protein C, PspC [Caldisalinibacter kiritimatiensis]
MNKRLYRSTNDKVISGVCGGVAEYFEIDPTIVRILWAVIALSSWGIGVFAYIVCIIVIPENPFFSSSSIENNSTTSTTSNSHSVIDPNRNKLALGIVLIGLGGFLLLKRFNLWFNFRYLLPTLLIVAGVYVLVRRKDEY